jgi:hypothetical protein
LVQVIDRFFDRRIAPLRFLRRYAGSPTGYWAEENRRYGVVDS